MGITASTATIMCSQTPTHMNLLPATQLKSANADANTYSAGGKCGSSAVSCFQMPLHYPRYTKADYDVMPEWRLDCLLREYGLPVAGDVVEKREFAKGAFLWPSQC